jgi:hypothetical protein
MSILQWFKGALGIGPRSIRTEGSDFALREFVYLDDVSVFSLMASRQGAIATQITETEARTLGGEVEGSTEASAGFAKAAVRGRTSTSQEQTSQVLRKAIIQSAFRDLYELEEQRLALRPAAGPPPDATLGIETVAEDGQWLMAADSLGRGQLIELEVELEAEAIFRINAVISAFLEIVQEDLEIFGVSTEAGLAEARAMNRVMDRLLTGLVPLRGRAIDMLVARVGERDLLVHRQVLEQISEESRPATRPLLVVGVAEQRLFWKDIRRVLFSNSRYRVFCRVSQPGLQAKWSPIKLTEVIGEVVPDFESQLLDALGDSTLAAMGTANNRTAAAGSPGRDTSLRAAMKFAEAVAAYHGLSVPRDRLLKLVDPLVTDASLENVAARRRVLGAVLEVLDRDFGVATPREVAAELRVNAIEAAGIGLDHRERRSAAVVRDKFAGTEARFLDTEFVAVYW